MSVHFVLNALFLHEKLLSLSEKLIFLQFEGLKNHDYGYEIVWFRSILGLETNGFKLIELFYISEICIYNISYYSEWCDSVR